MAQQKVEERVRRTAKTLREAGGAVCGHRR